MFRVETYQLKRFVPAGLVGVAYFVAATLSILASGAENQTIGIWSADIVVFAILIRNPWIDRAWAMIAVFAASVGAGMFAGLGLIQCLLFAVAAITGIAGCLWLTRSHGPDEHLSLTIKGFAGIILKVAGVYLFSGASLAMAGSLFLNMPGLALGGNWVLANAVGVAVILPFALTVSRKRLKGLRDLEVNLPLVAWTAFASVFLWVALSLANHPFVMVMVPLLMAATRLKPFELAVVCLSVGLVACLRAPATGLAVYQVAVAITALVPFLAGLLLRQTKNDQRRLAASEERYQRVMNDASVGILNVTPDGVIVDVNPAMVRMFGYDRPDQLQGRTVQEFTHPDDHAIGEDVRKGVREGKLRSGVLEKRYIKRDGTPIAVRISFSLITTQDVAYPMVCVSQVEDISERRRAEEHAKELQTRWDFALATAGQGVWSVDTRVGVSYSDTWSGMLGYRPGELDGDQHAWLDLVHPDDRSVVAEADEALRSGASSSFEKEFRMRHRDGRYLWILDRGVVLERDKSGATLRAMGTLTDISRRKDAEARLEREEERQRVTLNSIGDAVICVDADSLVSFMNPAAEKLTRVSAASALGKHLRAIYVVTEDEAKDEFPDPALDSQPFYGRHAVLIRQDGSRCAIREVVSPLQAESGQITGRVIVFQDFSNAYALHRQLTYAANNDMLTGLGNRSNFMNRMSALAWQAREDGHEHQLLYIDLDRFKDVNDGGGHAAGDSMLVRAAQTIKSAVRGQDVVARLGGDEFAVVMQNCPQDLAYLSAQSIVEAISQIEFHWDGKSYRIGASIGIATLKASNPDVDEVIADADKACYSVKRSGRGGVAIAVGPSRSKVIRLPVKRDGK